TGSAPAGFGGLNISAQGIGSNSAEGGTAGIRLNDSFVLHTGLAVGAGVDSNVFYQDNGAQSAAVTHIMPQLSLTNAARGGTPETNLELSLNGDYRQYYSDIQAIKDEGSAFGVGVSANLEVGTQTQLTGSLFDSFVRDVQASYIPGASEFSRDSEVVGG